MDATPRLRHGCMKFLPILKWMINITVFAALAAGGVAVYFWKNGDDLVRQEVLKKFHEAAPDLSLSVGATTLKGTQSVILSDIEVQERSTGKALFRAAELQVNIDSAQLLENQTPVIDRITLQSADVLLTRLEDGRWNWQQYKFVKPQTKAQALPEIILEDVRIRLSLRHGNGIPTATLQLASPKIVAVPTSQHGYDFDGAIMLPGAGLMKLGGMCDLETAQWEVGGHLKDIRADQNLMNLVQATTPQVKNQLGKVDTVMEQLLPSVQTVSAQPPGAALLIGNNAHVAWQISGLLDVDFAARSVEHTLIPAFQLRVNVRDGVVASRSLPIELSGVKATFFRDNQNMIFRMDEGRIDGARVSGDLVTSTAPNAAPPIGSFNIERFPITKDVRKLLPEKSLRIFDAFQPEGFVSARGKILRKPDGKWAPKDVVLDVHDGAAMFHKFRYPVTGLNGTIRQTSAEQASTMAKAPAVVESDILLDVTMTGTIGSQPLEATGWMKNPGPVSENHFTVRVNDFPLDGDFRNALPPKQRGIVESLDLTGTASGVMQFYRPPGLDQITQPSYDVRVKDGDISFRKFPYDITDLSGHLLYDGLNKHWTFRDLRGRHGNGQLAAHGEFRGLNAPGTLDLTIVAKNAALDADLYNALPRTQRDLWKTIDPDGFCDLTAKINWTANPGQAANVSFPQDSPIRIFDTVIRPTPFPFEMRVKEATLSFDPNDPRNAGKQHCEIHTFTAFHEQSRVQARGWAEISPDGEWQLHLNDLNARNLKPDDELRGALPKSWAETLARVDRSGSVSIENSEIDFRGDAHGERNTTASWNLNMRFHDCMFNAGLDVSHIYGLITAAGTWDGFHINNLGRIHLDTAEVLEMPFTNVRGPYSLNDVELIMGARQVFEPDSLLSDVNQDSRIKAQAYGGEILLDAQVDMRPEGRYQFFTELNNARLESYAALHIPDQRNLRGVVAAWMRLQGVGDDPADLTGSGQLRISPAALLELPVMVKLLSSLSQLTPNVQNLTAFDYAITHFKVAREEFRLERVDLVGDSISFRGKGSVGFGGAVDLDFYSRPARTRAASIPFISGLFTNWSKIEVRGTTDHPHVRTLALGQVDETMKQFLQGRPNPNSPIPNLTVPRFFQRAQPAPPRRRMQNAAGGIRGTQ